MRTIAILLLLLLAPISEAAVGDAIGASVLADGWRVAVTFSGMGTNGAYSYGLTSSNTLSAPKFKLTYTAQGYDGSGNLTTLTVTNYSGSRARAAILTGAADPNVADETPSGTNVVINFASTDYIPSGASNITLSLLAGLYVQGGITNTATSISVTNNSSQNYFKTVANWSKPPFENHTNSTATLELVAFHRSASAGFPVRCVRVIGTDEHSNTVSGVFSNWSMSTGGDAVPFGLLSCPISISSLTNGDAVRWDFVAYPWVGDTNSVLDTRKNEFTGITPLPSSITNLVNHTGGYAGSYALVRTNGNNATGVALTAAQYASNPSALTNAFLTIEGAAEAIAGTNNTAYSRNDCGGSFVLLDDGDYAWTGGTVTGGATTIPKTWLTITTNIGATTAGARITSSTGTQDVNDRSRFKGISFNTTANTFNNCERILFEDCDLTTTSTQFILQTSGTCVFYVLRGTVRGFSQGIKYASIYNISPGLVRGVTFNGFSGSVQPYNMLGCNFTNSPLAQIRMDYASQPNPIGECSIIYNNKLMANDLLDDSLKGPSVSGLAWGYAIVQNVFESDTNNTANLSWNFGSANSIHITNAFIAHNTAVGRKDFTGYNDTGTNVAWRIGWTIVNEYRDDYNNKSYDHGTTVGGGADTNRVGTESLKHGVGYSGWIPAEVGGIGAPMSFLPNPFYGLNVIIPTATNTPAWAGFKTRRSFDGSASSGAGYGDYSLSTNSPLIGLPLRWVLPYDIAGSNRFAGDTVGAFTIAASGGSGGSGSSGQKTATVGHLSASGKLIFK